MKKKALVITSVILASIALLIALYPTMSNVVNTAISKNTIDTYNNQVKVLSDGELEEYIEQAEKYNRNLANIVSDSFLPDAYDITSSYENTLSVNEDGLIGSVSIPKINVNLPIYHGVNETDLNKGAVHMANTSFPIGGTDTHSVISAHTAYPGKVFFDDLTDLTVGDEFSITVLDRNLKYKVTDINVVLPSDTTLLKIQKGKDLVTLVTCTPYSINTHRLLVTGERIESEKPVTYIPAESETPDFPYAFIIIIGSVLISGLVITIIIKKKVKRHEK